MPRGAYQVRGRMTVVRDDLAVDVWMSGLLTPGDPGCRTMRNGDPGWPPSPPEVDNLIAVDDEGNEVELTDDEIERATEILSRQ